MADNIIIENTPTPVRDMADAYVAQRAPDADEAKQRELWETFVAGFTAMFGYMLAIGFDPDPDTFARAMMNLRRELESHGAVIELIEGEPEPTVVPPTAPDKPKFKES